jgi:hypothetical protein
MLLRRTYLRLHPSLFPSLLVYPESYLHFDRKVKENFV